MTKVSEIMTKNVRTCSPHDPLIEAAKIMRDIDCGSVPICEGKKVTGIVTDRDIVIRCVAEGKDAKTAHCHDFTATDVVTCSSNTDVHECAKIMARHQIRRIPIVDNGELVGICAIGDLARVNIYVDEAAQALSDISEPDHLQH